MYPNKLIALKWKEKTMSLEDIISQKLSFRFMGGGVWFSFSNLDKLIAILRTLMKISLLLDLTFLQRILFGEGFMSI